MSVFSCFPIYLLLFTIYLRSILDVTPNSDTPHYVA